MSSGTGDVAPAQATTPTAGQQRNVVTGADGSSTWEQYDATTGTWRKGKTAARTDIGHTPTQAVYTLADGSTTRDAAQWQAQVQSGQLVKDEATGGYKPAQVKINPAEAGAADTITDPNIAENATQEKLIAAQDKDNPFSNATALARGISAEFAPVIGQAEDVAKTAGQYGLQDFLDTAGMEKNAIALTQEQADRDYAKANQELMNQYGGIGLSGNRARRASELAQDYSLDKAKSAQDLRQYFNQLGWNRNRELQNSAQDLIGKNQQVAENRFSNVLGSAMGQNAQAADIAKFEKGIEANRQDLITKLQHDAGMSESQANQAARAALQGQIIGGLIDMFMPQQESAADKYMNLMLAKELGADNSIAPQLAGYFNGSQGQQANPINDLMKQLLGTGGLTGEMGGNTLSLLANALGLKF
jgi:hypothetical protein